jgi:nucleoside-diphosphate-sugar epimerase
LTTVPNRYLLTGCAGFIGSHLTESLLDDGHHVVGVDCFNNNYGRSDKLRNLERARQWDSFEFVPIDLARGDLAELVADCDAIFHLAAEPGVRSSWQARFETYLRNNLQATQHLLDAAREYPDKRFVYASSSSIYGQAETFPTREDALPRPYSPYGVTKLAAEQLCDAYHANFGVQAVSLRYFSVYGPRQRPDMAFNRFCRAALQGDPITVFGDGEQTRDFTYVGDIVDATRAAAVADGVVGQAYNVGGGSRVSVNQALDLLRELTGADLDVQHLAREHGDVKDTGGDTTKAERNLGFAPKVTFAEGLAAELEWTRRELPYTSASPGV